MFTKKLFQVFIFLFVSVLFFSCRKEVEPLADLSFQVEEIDGVYHCNWVATNISTFKNYYIVHSPILMGGEDEPDESFSNRWTSLDLQTVNSTEIFIESKEGMTLYFQLFVEIGDRMIRSNVVTFEKSTSEVIDFNVNATILSQDWNALYMYNGGTQDFLYYDFIEKEVKGKRKLNLDFNQYFSCIGNNGFGDELYLIDGTKLRIFDAYTLTQNTSFDTFGYNIRAVTTSDNGLIILTVNDESSPIQILDRDGLTLLNSLTSSNYTFFGSRKVEFLSKENNELVEVGENYFKYFKIDDDVVVLEQEEIETPFPNSENFFHNITASPFENYFVVNFDGHVFNRSLNGLADLSTLTGGDYLNYFFNKDETVLYASIYNPNILEKSFVDKISIPDFQFVERKEYEGVMVNWFYRNDIIYGAFYSDYFKCVFIKQID